MSHTHTSATPKGLDIAGLETVYDEAGEARASLFLVKLALLNAQALGNAAQFEHHIQAALKDL